MGQVQVTDTTPENGELCFWFGQLRLLHRKRQNDQPDKERKHVASLNIAPQAWHFEPFLNDMGSKVKENGADLILAGEVVNGNDTVVLRDEKGNPVWNWHR